MWWRNLRCAALLLPLAACGFHPLYGERAARGEDPALASVEVHTAADRIGQITTDAIREELNPRGLDVEKRYVLNFTLSQARSDLGIRRDNTSSRGELVINAALQLRRSGSTAVVYQDSIHTVTAFDLSDDAYAAQVAEDKARTEAASELGREIAIRIQLFLDRQARGGT